MEALNHVYFQYAFKKILLVLFDSDLNAPPSKRSKRIYPASVNREEATNSKEGDKQPKSMYTKAATNTQTLKIEK